MLLLAKILISSAGMLKMSCNAHSATIRPRTDADGRGRTSSSLSASLSSLPFISLRPQIMFTKLSGQRGDNDGGDDNQDDGHDPKTSPKMWFIPHEKRGKTPLSRNRATQLHCQFCTKFWPPLQYHLMVALLNSS